MRSRSRHRAPRAVLAALWTAGALAVAAGVACASNPVRVTAAFDRTAALGAATALRVALQLDPGRVEQPLDEVRLAYPRSLGVVSSGLGLAACRRPPTDFLKVLITAPGLGGCSPNAVMAIGTARALVELTDGQMIPEYATVTLLSGALERGRLGLVVYVEGQHPFGAKLVLAGDVREVGGSYGGELTVRLPAIPGLEDLATIHLVSLRLTLGAHAIRYYETRGGRRVAYHPEGVALPTRCPADGFRFRVRVGFVDGSSRSATTVAPCPSTVAADLAGR